MKYTREIGDLRRTKELENLAAQASVTKDTLEYLGMMTGVDITGGEEDGAQQSVSDGAEMV